MLKKTFSGIVAGLMISLGGSVFLACLDSQKVVGAFLFSVALLSICNLEYSLYTGKICYLPEKCDKESLSVLLFGLLGNLLGTVWGGLLIHLGLSNLGDTAYQVCSSKLLQSPVETLIRGFFCGMLIYIAVEIYKKKNSNLGILIAIPAFILSGFEHSIADMFYFAASGIVSLEAFGFIWLVIAGNTLGGSIIPLLKKIKD